MADEHGPFATEREAWDTEACKAEQAAWEANPVPGEGEKWNLRMLVSAIEELGVELGDYDHSPLRQVAMYETSKCVALRGIIRRAYEAGLAREQPEGTVTEWALAYTHRPNVTSGLPARRVVQPYPSESEARAAVADLARLAPEDEPALMRRDVGPWTPVPESEDDDA